MVAMNRRAVLATMGTVALGGVAGCSSFTSDGPPAGSLQFVNEHSVPHAISVRVTDVGSSTGDDPREVEGDPIVPSTQRELTASTVVEPGESQTYEGAFTEPVWYAVRFTVDGSEPEDDTGVVAWTPAPPDDDRGNVLSGNVTPSGGFTWVITRTENRGRFD